MRDLCFADKFIADWKYLVLYQVAMLTCLAAECTATYSLSKYEDLQGRIENSPLFGGHLYQNDLIDAEIVTIVRLTAPIPPQPLTLVRTATGLLRPGGLHLWRRLFLPRPVPETEVSHMVPALEARVRVPRSGWSVRRGRRFQRASTLADPMPPARSPRVPR